MEELYGPITAFLVSAVVTGISQLIKEYWSLEGKSALLASLGIAILFFVPFHIIWSDAVTAKVVYSAFIYAFLGFFSAAGLYSTAKTVFTK